MKAVCLNWMNVNLTYLNDLVRDVAEIIHASVNERREFYLTIDDSLHAQVLGDKQRLEQILVNILDNASKYTGEEGNISFYPGRAEKE